MSSLPPKRLTARKFILSKNATVESLLSKSIGLESRVIFKTLRCLESECHGEASFGVATCLVDFTNTKGGGKIALNISSDETGALSEKEISVVVL